MENDNKKIHSLTIAAAVISGINILCYIVLIVAMALGLLKAFPDSVLLVLYLGLPVLSIAAFVLAIKCRRENVKPFWIPNLIISIFLLIASLPTSCATWGISFRNEVDTQTQQREQRIRDLVYRQVTIDFIKEDMTMRYGEQSSYKEIREQFVSMEFTLLDVYADSHFELEDSSFYGINTGGGNQYDVTLFADCSGIRIHASAQDHQFIGGMVKAEATRYYSCNQEEGRKLYGLIHKDEQSNAQSSQSIEQSMVAFYL